MTFATTQANWILYQADPKTEVSMDVLIRYAQPKRTFSSTNEMHLKKTVIETESNKRIDSCTSEKY